MNVLVVGATGGSGRAVVDALLERGHRVTAFTRRADAIATRPGLRVCEGDACVAADVERAVAGHDAVVVALGIRENAALVRLRGSAHTPMDVRSVGTRHVIAAMQRHGVRDLVVQTTYGVGETHGRLPLQWRILFKLLLGPQIDDTRVQEAVVRESGLRWVLVQPVALGDDDGAAQTFASTEGDARRMSIPRRNVGVFIAEAIEGGAYAGRSVALSTV